MKGRIADKIALITGAAQGIGEACARLFIREGATVFLTDIQDDLGKDTAKELGPKAHYLHLDVQKEENWEKVISAIIKQKDRLDILVNNAGITGFQKGFGPQDPEHASLESWRKIHAINSEGTFLGCKHAIQVMKKGKGSIINISSRSGLVGIPGAAAYAASKAEVRNHTKSVALYCCQNGYDIRCNSVHPAAIMTPMWEEMLGPKEGRKERIAHLVKDIPMQKFGDPEDVAFAVLFLASEESKYMTGSELTIDGGILAGSSASPKKD
ncbi:MAG TPA: glucose 1-dehydrogenase [Rhabdochlamydiaceae bacterium]|nr:glucose 1-dehydrogenase [Rhabdochlamydiaceae bacterium]